MTPGQAVSWLLGHSHALGTAALAAIIVYVLWNRAIHSAVKQKIDVTVTRDAERGKQEDWQNAMLQWMELDAEEVARYDCKILSLGEYMASLQAHGSISLQAALISIMDRYGLRLALPLALFAPPKWRKAEPALERVFAATPYASLVLVNTISTLHLLALSSTVQRYNADAQKRKAAEANARVEAQWAGALADAVVEEAQRLASPSTLKQAAPSALQLMILGSNPQNDGGMAARCPTPFNFPGDVAAAAGVSAEVLRERGPPATSPDPSAIHPLFPGLCNGNGGLPLLASEGQASQNAVTAMLLNKLAANALIGALGRAAGPQQRFVVKVAGRDVDSVEGFMEALEGSGHGVRLHITSNVTSFGVGLCAAEDADRGGNGGDAAAGGGVGWAHIPLAYPLCTGLFAQDAAGNDVDVMTLMVHAALQLDVSGPLAEAHLEWCLSINGTTGWLPKNGVNRPWQSGREANPQHAAEALASPAGRRSTLRLTTASAAALNAAATRHAMMFGGYGFLGVCIDSVAAVQQALTGTTTLYPLTLGGDAKMSLLQQYVQMQGIAGGRWEYDAEATALRAAVLAVPCDGVVEPGQAAATARRALASLPERSVFAGVKRCREALQEAARLAQAIVPPTGES